MLKLIEDSHEILIRHCGRVAKESTMLIHRVGVIHSGLCIRAVFSVFFFNDTSEAPSFGNR